MDPLQEVAGRFIVEQPKGMIFLPELDVKRRTFPLVKVGIEAMDRDFEFDLPFHKQEPLIGDHEDTEPSESLVIGWDKPHHNLVFR